eukprot:3465238-Rhodomonas_salina.2
MRKEVVDKRFTTTQYEDTEIDALDPLYTDPEHNLFRIEEATKLDEFGEYAPDPIATTILVLPSGEQMTRTTDNAILWSWHKTSGCINTKYLMTVAGGCKGMEEVAKLPKCTTIPNCDACLHGKAHRHSPPKKQLSH